MQMSTSGDWKGHAAVEREARGRHLRSLCDYMDNSISVWWGSTRPGHNMPRVEAVQGTRNAETSEPITVVTRLRLHAHTRGDLLHFKLMIQSFPLEQRCTLRYRLPSSGRQSGVHFPSSCASPRLVVGGASTIGWGVPIGQTQKWIQWSIGCLRFWDVEVCRPATACGWEVS